MSSLEPKSSGKRKKIEDNRNDEEVTKKQKIDKKEKEKRECKICEKTYKKSKGYVCCSGEMKKCSDNFYCNDCVLEKKYDDNKLFLEYCTECQREEITCSEHDKCVEGNCEVSVCKNCYLLTRGYMADCMHCNDFICLKCEDSDICEQCYLLCCEYCSGEKFEPVCKKCGMGVFPLSLITGKKKQKLLNKIFE